MAIEHQSSARMIRFVTEALLAILRNAFRDTELPAERILASPPEIIPRLEATSQMVALYLYNVEESAELKNQGPDYEELRGSGDAPAVRIRRDPLSLNLHYLLIPFSGGESYLDTYDLLGVAMKAFHDHGIFSPGELGIRDLVDEPPMREPALQYRLTLERLSTEQLSGIWEAVQEPYRLSVSYVVRTVQIRSDLTTDARRVIERGIDTVDRGRS